MKRDDVTPLLLMALCLHWVWQDWNMPDGLFADYPVISFVASAIAFGILCQHIWRGRGWR